jgi:hypothetical protein
MEKAGSSETLVPIFQTRRCHTPKDSNHHFVTGDELGHVLPIAASNIGSDLERRFEERAVT